jgi:ferrous iron transport protein B
MSSVSTTSEKTVAAPPRGLTVALAGNPNAGKTTLFNALTGLRQKVANYPGVTVERKEGVWQIAPDAPAQLIDLPGLYSLEAASPDEQIARDVLTGRVAGLPLPDVLVAVADATNLARNLYLVTQLLEFGRPLVLALTMCDLAERKGLEIDLQELSAGLGVKAVPVVAASRRGLDELAAAVAEAARRPAPEAGWRLPEKAERELSLLAANNGHSGRRQLVKELYGEDLPADAGRRGMVVAARERLAQGDAQWWQAPVLARYAWLEQIAARATRETAAQDISRSERIDRVLTHKIAGPLILLGVMCLVFVTIFSLAETPMTLLETLFGGIQQAVKNALPPGLLADLLTDGIIAGVGGVVVFLPQILLLFFFISVLEDTGYLARAAFILDRLMRGVGLHGKAFVPLLSSFACAIPGVMATRTIENPKDRLATIMIAPFMSCSARLPVYALMIGAFFVEAKLFGFLPVGGLLMVAMYLLGILVAVCVAWLLKRTILRAPTPPLVLELPPYRAPNFRVIVQTMFSRAGLFLQRAGTVILAISIILWALATFPRLGDTEATALARQETGQAEPSEKDIAGARLRHSLAGRGGRILEPFIAPLGFDWKTGIALISSFAARETLVSTLKIIYNLEGGDAEVTDELKDAVREARRPDGGAVWTPLAALSLMVFFVLAMQCMSTLAIVRRETNSWRWPLFMLGYMTALAYVAAFVTYQGGRLLGFS